MKVRTVRVGILAVSLALSATAVFAGQSNARACGGYMSPGQQARLQVRSEAARHIAAIHPGARDVRVEVERLGDTDARVHVWFTVPGVGARVRTIDLARSVDGQWAVRSMRRGRLMARLVSE